MSIKDNFPSVGPSLSLNFARSKTLDPRITFARSSTSGDATYMNENGLIVTAAADEPRFDHKYENGVIKSLGLLIEEQRTNYIEYSEELDDTGWYRQSVGISTNTTTSPSGEITAEKIIDDTSSGQHWLRKRVTGLSTNLTYTVSAYLKFDSTNSNFRHLRLAITDAETGGSSYSSVTISTSGIGTVTNSDFTDTSAGITTLPNGWYRAHLTFTNVGVTDELALRFILLTNSDSSVYTGDGSSGVFVWGAQLEKGAFPTSYIPTTSSQATRSPDEVSMTGTNFSDWYNQDEGTVYASQKLRAVQNTDRNNLVYLINGGSGNDYFYNAKGGDSNIFAFADGGTFYSRFQDGTDSTDTKTAWAYDVSGDDFKAYYNGIEATNESTTNTPSATSHNQLELGATALDKYCGHISQLTYYPRRLTNDQLQSLTK